jgi:hypothetical protein
MYQSNKIDRTVFFAGTHEQMAVNDTSEQKKMSYAERIGQLTFLSNCLYGFSKKQPSIDRTVFSARKLD